MPTEKQKLLALLAFVVAAFVLITLGCGMSWGLSGALIGGGITCAVYAFVTFHNITTK